MTITIALFGYAAVFAVVGPHLLRGGWLDRSPRLALALWHASAASVLLASGLASVACYADSGLLRSWLQALTDRSGITGVIAASTAVAVPASLVARVVVAATRLARSNRTERRRHLELLALLGRHDPQLGATVIPADAPAAYCVPGTHRIVLTSGAVDVLDDAQVRAVLAHEQAHLAGRHHLVVAWAAVLGRAFPAVPLFGAIWHTTAHLIELLADDRTVRRESGRHLATAIAALGYGRSPAVGLAVSGGSALARVERLLNPPKPLPLVTRVGGAGAAVSIMAGPVMLAVTPTLLTASLVWCPHIFG